MNPSPSSSPSPAARLTSARAKEVLYDSETVLRLVDRELDELRLDELHDDAATGTDPDGVSEAGAIGSDIEEDGV